MRTCLLMVFAQFLGVACELCFHVQVNRANAESPIWVSQGSAPNTQGQVENVGMDNEVVGAINVLAPHPDDAEVLYVGAVNGGIWKTTNAMAASPSWTNQTDHLASLSIGALEFDPSDADQKTLVAGTGGSSSFGTQGARIGLLRTSDGGGTWQVIDGDGDLQGLNISGVAPRGAVIVLSAVQAMPTGGAGVWRSSDTGTTWQQVSGTAMSGLPAGRSYVLTGVPNDSNRLFTNAGSSGLYRSDDTGSTWTKVSHAAMDSALQFARNVRIAAGSDHNVYVAIVGSTGQLAAVFHSVDSGNSWQPMGLPAVGDSGIHPGRQGSIHFSLAADPDQANIVYIGGDRQEGFFPFPNAIGARDYTGCLFRGDVSRSIGEQWVHLTHSNSLGSAGGGTASNSAPHADSRDMAIAANGVLIEADDGGVYRRTSPLTNSGDWFSMNGNLQTSEYHSVAWDANSNVVIAGAQDTGTAEQLVPANTRFQSIATADGGDVAVDDTSTPGHSVRYSSNQFLGGFRRRVFDAQNELISTVPVALTVVGGGAAVAAQFYTPITLNNVDARRLIIGAGNSVYESTNQGDTVREIGPGIRANGSGLDPIAYGATGNADMLYVGAGTRVFVRTAAHPARLTASATYPGGFVMSVCIDPDDPETAIVADPSSVFHTNDAGVTWTDLRGNLGALEPGVLRSVALIPAGPGAVIVGSDAGIFTRSLAPAGGWTQLGTGLPNVPVYHLEYDAADDILLAATLGRGAWTLQADTPVPEAVLAAADEAETPPARPELPPQENREGDGGMDRETSIVLSDGVIVDSNQRLVFLMTPEGGIDAVDVGSGEAAWRTQEAAKPLSAASGRLVGQASGRPEDNAMRIVVLNSRTGQQIVEGATELPPGIRPSIDDTLEGAFAAYARATADDVIVTWQFEQRPTTGLPPGFQQGLAPAAGGAEAVAPDRIGVLSGTVRMDLDSGRMESLNVEAPAAAMTSPDGNLEVPQANRIEGPEGEQYFSVDGQHVIVSVRHGDDNVWDKYTLAIFDRASTERIGEIKSHVAIAPLVILDSTAIYELSPYSRRVDGQLKNEPLKIHAVDLTSGNELWSRTVRDTEYRGPFPP